MNITDEMVKLGGKSVASAYQERYGSFLGATAAKDMARAALEAALGDVEPEPGLQERVGVWGDATFPRSTPETICAHLHDETLELAEAIHVYERGPLDVDPLPLIEHVREETADVYLLLLHLAHRFGFDLHKAAEEKFATVQTRTYTTDSGRGYTRHDAGGPDMTEQQCEAQRHDAAIRATVANAKGSTP